MPRAKKRQWAREPLTWVEELDGKSYYSAKDFGKIYHSFSPRPGLDHEKFERRIEGAACMFIEWAAMDPEHAPSSRERLWQALRGRIDGLLKRLDDPDNQLPGLWQAALALAKREGALPDFPPEVTPLAPVPGNEATGPSDMTIWPVEQQLEKCLRGLRWLRGVTSEAARIAEKEKDRPGNRPIEPKHFIIQELAQIYRESAAKPTKPWKDGIKVGGESIDFLLACLRPLGVPDSPKVIYDTYRRAGAKLIKE